MTKVLVTGGLGYIGSHTIAARRPGDVQQIYADTKISNTELGWKPELGIEEMVQTAWEWGKNAYGIQG